MKVLILNSILYTADNNIVPKVESIRDTMIYGFASGFVKLGHSVTLVASEEFKPVREETYPFEIVFLKSNWKSVFKVSLLPLHFSLYSFLKKKKNDYDLVISSESFSFDTCMAARVMPEKLVIWQELFMHNRKFFRLPSRIWYNLVVRFGYGKVACVVARSERARLFIGRYAASVAGQLVEHGIDLDKYGVLQRGEKQKQFIVVSQLLARKRIDRIIRHFHAFLAKPGYGDFVLKIVGRGDQEESLKKLAEELGMRKQVEFCGFLTHKELCPLIAASQALLIDTEKDMNMVTIPESIAGGTPIVVNTVPSNSFYVEKHRLGIVKDRWTEDDLMEIVLRNAFYSSNCLAYREQLRDTAVASEIIRLFNEHKECRL